MFKHLSWVALCLGMLGWARPAAAFFYYSPTFVIPTRLVVNNQWYDFSVGGLEDLCATQPNECAQPQQQAALTHLSTLRTVGWTLLGAAAAAAVVGAAVPLATAHDCSDYDDTCSFNLPLLLGLEGGSLALAIAGWIVFPTNRDVMNFVNMANGLHPDLPIELRVRADPDNPGLLLAAHF